MNAEMRSRDVATCSVFHGLLAMGMGAVGSITAAILVNSIAPIILSISAAVFSAPLVITGVVVVLAYGCLSSKCLKNYWFNFALQATLLACAATITIVTALYFGVVMPSTCIVFASFYALLLLLLGSFSLLTYLYPPKPDYQGSNVDVVIQAVGSIGNLIDVVD